MRKLRRPSDLISWMSSRYLCAGTRVPGQRSPGRRNALGSHPQPMRPSTKQEYPNPATCSDHLW